MSRIAKNPLPFATIDGLVETFSQHLKLWLDPTNPTIDLGLEAHERSEFEYLTGTLDQSHEVLDGTIRGNSPNLKYALGGQYLNVVDANYKLHKLMKYLLAHQANIGRQPGADKYIVNDSGTQHFGNFTQVLSRVSVGWDDEAPNTGMSTIAFLELVNKAFPTAHKVTEAFDISRYTCCEYVCINDSLIFPSVTLNVPQRKFRALLTPIRLYTNWLTHKPDDDKLSMLLINKFTSILELINNANPENIKIDVVR